MVAVFIVVLGGTGRCPSNVVGKPKVIKALGGDEGVTWAKLDLTPARNEAFF